MNPVLALLSGGLTLIEALPKWVQPPTPLDPAHAATIARGALAKGAGLNVFYPDVVPLLALAPLFIGVSAWRFREQVG